MFKSFRRSRINGDLKELEMHMVAQAIDFAIAVTGAFDTFVGQSEEPTFRLIFWKGQPTRYSSHLNQLTLMIEGLCFFLHCLNRIAFRPDSETLRELVFDPTVQQIVRLLSKIFKSLSTENDTKVTEDDLLLLVSERELQYGAMPSVVGKDLDDGQSAYRVASLTIANMLGRPRNAFLHQMIRTELLEALVRVDLITRVERIEAMI
jgi:hypothetical protein